MKRSVFMVIAGVMAIFFGLTMVFNPGQMLDMVAIDTNLSTRVVLQWMGCPLIAIGIMNILARNDGGSLGLRAIMIGNILLHFLGAGIDVFDFANGYLKVSGLAMGAVVHGVLIIGFGFYLSRLAKSPG